MKKHNMHDLGSEPPPTNNGYWVECVPLRPRSWLHLDPGLYSASIDGLPDVQGLGLSPDRAIAKLQRRLAQVRAERIADGAGLPPTHSPLTPPKRLQGHHGWMSVYVAVGTNDT
jgi:hypothetical protein